MSLTSWISGKVKVLTDSLRVKFDRGIDAVRLYIGGSEVISSGRKLVGLSSVAQHLNFDGDNAYDIGSSSAGARDVYVSRNIEVKNQVRVSGGVRNRDFFFYPEMVFVEAENLSRSGGATLVDDATASGGICVKFPSTSASGLYGPYKKILRGNYLAIYRVKVSSNTSTSNLVKLDVVGNYGSSVYGSVWLRPFDLESSNTWYNVSFEVNITEDRSDIELRAIDFQTGITDLYIDYIILLPITSQLLGNLKAGMLILKKGHQDLIQLESTVPYPHTIVDKGQKGVRFWDSVDGHVEVGWDHDGKFTAGSADASFITSGRFTMSRMPDGENKKVLVAKGAGTNPSYDFVPTYNLIPYSRQIADGQYTYVEWANLPFHHWWVICFYAVATQYQQSLSMRLNDDSGTVYAAKYIQGTSIYWSTGQSSFLLVAEPEPFSYYHAMGWVWIQGYPGPSQLNYAHQIVCNIGTRSAVSLWGWWQSVYDLNRIRIETTPGYLKGSFYLYYYDWPWGDTP